MADTFDRPGSGLLGWENPLCSLYKARFRHLTYITARSLLCQSELINNPESGESKCLVRALNINQTLTESYDHDCRQTIQFFCCHQCTWDNPPHPITPQSPPHYPCSETIFNCYLHGTGQIGDLFSFFVKHGESNILFLIVNNSVIHYVSYIDTFEGENLALFSERIYFLGYIAELSTIFLPFYLFPANKVCILQLWSLRLLVGVFFK